MKTMKRNISLFVALLTLGLTSTSCLKDKAILDPEGSKNIVEFYNVTAPTSAAASPVVTYVPMTLEVVPESEFKMMISYSGAELAAPQDITVQLAAAPEIVTTYNSSQGAALVQVDPAHIDFPSSVTIPKGQKRVEISVKVKSDQLDPSVSNAFGVKIVSASHGIISGNFGAVIFSLPIKSVWEGAYTYTVVNATGTIDANIGGTKTVQNVRLSTVGPNRLRVNGLWQTYSGWSEYQFNATSDNITEIANFSGSNIPGTNIVVHEADPVAGRFDVSWIGLGRGVRETWVRTGD
jgi:hypothetical protein